MGSLPTAEGERRQQPPHVVMVPYPAQGHVTPMLQLAKLLYTLGFHITFVNNEFNHRRHLRARGPGALDGAPGFRFAAINDGLPPSEVDATQDVPALCYSTMTTCLPRFKDLVARTNAEAEAQGRPTVTCVVADSIMTFALRGARELGLRCATLWTASACGFIGYYYYRHLVERGIVPLENEARLTDGYLDTVVVDWIPGAPKDLRLRDFPSFVRTTDPDDIMLNFFIHEVAGMSQASAVVINTFDELDATLLHAMAKLLSRPIYTVGPLPLTVRNNVPADSPVTAIGWPSSRGGWSTPATPSCGTCARTSSRAPAATLLAPEFLAATEGRSMLSTWCPQAAVLEHEGVGVFLTHSGWNSTLESICGGVPMVCWPFFAEQQTNCRYKHTEWGIGMEIGNDVRRGEVEVLIREAMEGEKGREMRRRVTELKESAVAAARLRNVGRLIDEVLLA
ncbi:unnamed protein product [Miscanthus lutarioriparius]|uniref:Glycosyltransferase n=1 Tax=Miscanthus lutarioriparius TaxID=422564 RepID=A0A811R5Q8_9POAL|nr:unnamed protein product [Miscanthus lutarioriparius]